jgi:single-stranded-DNA-specific exonuclease
LRWTFLQPDSVAVERLAGEAGVTPLVARLLTLRGVDTGAGAAEFLRPSLAQLHSPGLMRGMRDAVDRLSAAIANREDILIYGDYDADGTTAVVILKTAIELCGGVADFHVPHRIKEGYGIKDDVIERAAAAGVKVVISVDTGIRAFQAAETARRVGLDLIVTDHHLPETNQGVPSAYAVLNPNQQGCDYPCKALCGAGVAFKLAQALFAKFKDTTDQERLTRSFLKMVAIATIADAVPLVGENRAMAKLGLEGLRRPMNGGLKALLEVSGLADNRRALVAGDVGFRLGPRINAAGRMDVARDVVELFTSRDPERWGAIAARLDLLNRERQNEEARIVAEIDLELRASPEWTSKYCLVLDGEGWHRGVVGIVASRVVEKTGRPALVIAKDGEEAHGSGRSITGLHMLEALESCHDLFTRFGGHEHAVGFSLPSVHLDELKHRLNKFARDHLSEDDLVPEVKIDAEIPLEWVTPQLRQSLCQLEPFGHGNSEPVFSTRGVSLTVVPQAIKEKHLKMRVSQRGRNGKSGFSYDAMGWRMAARLENEVYQIGDQLDVVFRIRVNEHPEFGGLELTLMDFKKSLAIAASV